MRAGAAALLESSNWQRRPRQRHIVASLPKASAYSCVVFGCHRHFGRPLSPVERAQSEPPGSGGNAWGSCFGNRGASIWPDKKEARNLEGGRGKDSTAMGGAMWSARPHLGYARPMQPSKRGEHSAGPALWVSGRRIYRKGLVR